ncbi:hypothetical protein GCM10010517_74090 [Streptosporangium fragile]|uniref:Secreted protein n=2 Tax=Streptosporangium fragile TaxID=46186 RepID=A0ABN3WBV5_9ACTN
MRGKRSARKALHLSLLAGLAVAAVAVTPSTGHAATGAEVKVYLNTISHIAGPGEANRVRFSKSGSRIIVQDAVPISPGDGCDRVTDTQVSCTSEGVGAVVALLGDGSDSIAIDIPMSSYVDGGAGGDAYYGGTAPSMSRVFYIGGDNHDWVSYQATALPVSVTMDSQNNDGRIGMDQDNIQPSVETAILNQAVTAEGMPAPPAPAE